MYVFLDSTLRYLGRQSIDGFSKRPMEIVKSIIEYLPYDVDDEKVDSFVNQWKKKWVLANRTQVILEKKNLTWLDTIFPQKKTITFSKTKRASKPFESISDSQKRRRTVDIRSENSTTLMYATSSSLRADGKISASKLMEQVNKSPTRADKILKAYEKSKNSTESLDSAEAVALIAQMKLTKEQYEVLRGWSKKKGLPKMFPSYGYSVVKEKQKCYPEKISINETEAIVELQSLLDHTATRLMTSLKVNQCTNYTVHYKWGMDAGSGHSEFKQAFEDSNSSDSTVFITTIVPVLIEDRAKNIVWQNPAPNSTRFCRPVRIKYEKESKETTEAEYKRVMEQVEKLETLHTDDENASQIVNHCTAFNDRCMTFF